LLGHSIALACALAALLAPNSSRAQCKLDFCYCTEPVPDEVLELVTTGLGGPATHTTVQAVHLSPSFSPSLEPDGGIADHFGEALDVLPEPFDQIGHVSLAMRTNGTLVLRRLEVLDGGTVPCDGIANPGSGLSEDLVLQAAFDPSCEEFVQAHGFQPPPCKDTGGGFSCNAGLDGLLSVPVLAWLLRRRARRIRGLSG
jgi:hypothetical protein